MAQTVELPAGFSLEPVVRGLRAATDVAFAPDGRIFFTEKEGTVRIAEDGVLRIEPFIDLRDRVNPVGDRGLVGIAVHPRFPDVPYVYLAYAYDPPELAANDGAAGPNGGGSRVSQLIRVSADPASDHATALPGSEVLLLGRNSTAANIPAPGVRNPLDAPACGMPGGYVRDCLPADEHSHTIGRVRFGPDGALYVASGDGADYKTTRPYHVRALDVDSLAGKLLRIDPETGRGLPDNPFWDGDPESNRSKVLNFGLRNPYSFTFHPTTWDPVMGDVGWARWEEVNVGRGRNFGWPCYEGADEGNLPQPDFRGFDRCRALYEDPQNEVAAPAFAFRREGTASAIIAGDIYTGQRYPEAYRGKLYVADYLQAWIRRVTLDTSGAATAMEPFASVPFPVHVSQDPYGYLVYLNVWDGTLWRLRHEREPANRAPEPIVRATPQAGTAPLIVDLDATLSRDPDGDPLTLAWDVGDGRIVERGEATAKAYFFEGTHSVTVTATDPSGASATARLVVHAGAAAPTATIAAPAPGASYAVGDVIRFEGRGADADGGVLPDDALQWRLIVRGDGEANPRGLPPDATGRTGSFFAADWGEDVTLDLCLSVRDDDGVPASTCREIRLD